MSKTEKLYLQIANGIEHQIRHEVLKVGDKLPSLRIVALEKGVSLATAQQAYFELESRGLISSRPQSGYFVLYAHRYFRDASQNSYPIEARTDSDAESIIATVSLNICKAKVNLSKGVPALSLLPVEKLNKAIMSATRNLKDSGLHYDIYYDIYGNENLKKQIAARSLMWGGKLKAHNIISTSGCIEAISCCLMAITEKGDTIAVQSPVYFGLLRFAKSLGLNVLEIPTDPNTGIEVDALKKSIEKHKVKLCMLVSNFGNPLGDLMPDEHKRAVVKVMEKHNIPLIENDLYGDLYFGKQRPSCCKTYDESGLVLLCSSFSKTLAPGYRVGWMEPGKFREKVARTKYSHSLHNTAITHEAIAGFLENGRYENHLRKLRQTLHKNLLHFVRSINQYFPDDTKVNIPQGGLHLWIEFNKKVNTIELYNRAMAHKISIAPGRMFTLENRYNNCIKLNFGLEWDEKVEGAIKLLGKLATQ